MMSILLTVAMRILIARLPSWKHKLGRNVIVYRFTIVLRKHVEPVGQ